jgi:hypothetical protein
MYHATKGPNEIRFVMGLFWSSSPDGYIFSMFLKQGRGLEGPGQLHLIHIAVNTVYKHALRENKKYNTGLHICSKDL